MSWIGYLLELHNSLDRENELEINCKHCKESNHYMNKKYISCGEVNWKR